MMRQYLLFLLVLSHPLLAEKATLIYEDYFGEYSSGEESSVEVDIERDSVKSLHEKLKLDLVRKGKSDQSDILLIAYGVEDSIPAYFGGTSNLKNEKTLKNVFAEIKASQNFNQKEAKFYFRFVARDYAKYAIPEAVEHFWGSPWRHLPTIAKRVVFF